MATARYRGGVVAVLVVMLISLSGSSVFGARTLKIGGLFDPVRDIQSERMFDFSIEYYNKLSLLSNVTLLSIKEHAGAYDPYQSITAVKRLLGKGVAAVIGPSTSASVRATNIYCSHCQVPQLAPSATDPTFKYQSQLYSFLVRLQPSDDIQAMALLDLIKYYKWGKLSILSSTMDYGNNGMMEFRKLCEEEGLEINIDESFPVSNNMSHLSQSTREILAKVKSQHAKLVILNCHAQHAHIILNTAAEMQMVEDWVWILTDGAITEALQYPLGVIGVRSSVARESTLAKKVDKLWKELYPLNRMTTRAAKTFDAVTALVYALMLMPKLSDLSPQSKTGSADFCRGDELSLNARSALMEQIKKVKAEGLTQQIEFTEQGSQVHASYDVVNFDRSKTWHKVGFWRKESSKRLRMDPSHLVIWPNGGVTVPNDATIEIRFKNFKVLTAVSPPFVIQTNTSVLGTGQRYIGFCIDLLDAIRQELGFSYVIEARTSFGHKSPSGEWTGIFGELIREEADLAVSTFTISPERQKIVDFTQPFFNLGFKILMRRSDRMTEHNIWGFLSPFSARLWVAIICCTVVIGIVVWIYDVLSPNGFYGKYAQAQVVSAEDQQQKSTLSFSNSYWSATAAYLAQGPDGLHPRAPSGRITTITWWFAIYLFGATYTANLVAFLTVDQWAFPIQSIEDLANQEKIQYGTVPHSQLANMLEKGSLPVYEKLWSFMQRKNTFVNNVKTAIDRVRSDHNFAFIWDSTRLDYAVNIPPCNTLVTVGRTFGNVNYGFALPPNSPYTQNFSVMLLKLRRHGYIDKLNEKWFSGRAQCGAPQHEQHSDNSAEELGVLDLAGVFVTIATGVCAACVVLLCEIITASYQDRNKRNLNMEAPRTINEAIRQRLRRAWRGLTSQQ